MDIFTYFWQAQGEDTAKKYREKGRLLPNSVKTRRYA